MYNHKDVEKEVLEFWKKHNIYQKSKDKNKGSETFYFCDGPPYATGQIHPGTGWNKTLKDAFCRYQRLNGKDVRFQPGFDTHGLPIEVKVEQELKFKHKNEIEKYGMDKFVDRCKSFATKYIGIMSGQFESLGVWMDFDNPYVTYKDSYINSSWKTIKMAQEKGLLYEGVYVLPYCYRCETTIANYELEYADETDPSVYVKFKVTGKENEYLVIWTTTPWTLVANMAVMVHPTLQYVRAKVGEEIWVVAKERLEYITKMLDTSAVIIEEIPGRKLKDIQYSHPFQDLIAKEYDRKVVLSDEFVTLEDGSGLVHTAPGHGPADFIIGKRFGIEPFSPVDEQGNYTKDAGSFVGKNVREANSEIIKLMKENGSLVYEARIRHRYPHCWRCKTPLIFLTTNQWFISISKIKEQMISEIDSTNWNPDFAKERFKEFVTGAPDWCISRQRFWGIPLPIWKCSCGKVKVIESKDEIPKIKELHRPFIDTVKLKCDCGEEMNRIPDVLDVWFDSGNAVWASLDEKEAKTFGEHADLIIEGQDQIRGWFYSLLGSGIIRYGSCPYKNILMHGFFVDEKGEKMSKSVGNFVPIEQILEKYGADSFRLWGIGNTIWDELKFSWDEMKKCTSDLNILQNLVVFLERFYTTNQKPSTPKSLSPIDHWLLSRLNSTITEFRNGFENHEPNRSAKALRAFIVEDLSRFYMKVAKERISADGSDESNAALYSIYISLLESLKMLGCFSPFISEHLYQKFFKKFEGAESIFLLGFANLNLSSDSMCEKQMESIKEIVSVALVARQNAGVKVRWPVRHLYVQTQSHEVKEALKSYGQIVLGLLNAKELKVDESVSAKDAASADFTSGTVFIEKKIDQELYEEGMFNEVKRRVQMLRKEAKFVESDKIQIHINCEKEIEAIVEKFKQDLLSEVNSKSVQFDNLPNMTEYTIDGRLVRISISKA